MRRVTSGERAFLRQYFGEALAIDRIWIGSSLGTRSWSPIGGRISLTRNMFCDRTPRAEVWLEQPAVAGVFAHEALHVWQRQRGRRVTWEGAGLQAAYALGVFDPYAYDARDADPATLLTRFVLGNIEQQGRMFQDYVEADLLGHDTARFQAVAAWVRHDRR